MLEKNRDLLWNDHSRSLCRGSLCDLFLPREAVVPSYFSFGNDEISAKRK